MGGGRKGKKNGGKNKSFNMVNGVRLALEDEELYAVCLKVFGGGMCSVKCEDGATRTCVMRSKFRGRDKRSNMLSHGVWVLVGVRDWEGCAHGKAAKCDLLEVYNAPEKDLLVQTNEERDLSALTGIKPDGVGEHSEFDFVDAKTQGYRDLIEEDAAGGGGDAGGGGGARLMGDAYTEEERQMEMALVATAGAAAARGKRTDRFVVSMDDAPISVDDI